MIHTAKVSLLLCIDVCKVALGLRALIDSSYRTIGIGYCWILNECFGLLGRVHW